MSRLHTVSGSWMRDEDSSKVSERKSCLAVTLIPFLERVFRNPNLWHNSIRWVTTHLIPSMHQRLMILARLGMCFRSFLLQNNLVDFHVDHDFLKLNLEILSSLVTIKKTDEILC